MASPALSIRRAGVATIIACALAACAQTPAAKQEAATAAVQWQSVGKTDNQEAFIDPASVRTVEGYVEAQAKQNFGQPQPAAKAGKTYLSSLSTYRFDCAQRRIAMKRVEAHAGADLQGEVVQKATSTDKNLAWLDAPAGTVFGELVDYACRR